MVNMPIRDFECMECGEKQERFLFHLDQHVKCGCGGQLRMLERSDEGKGRGGLVKVDGRLIT